MNYRAEIDGLRALAVVPVILFHAGFKMFGGGFVGVDVFFVISGYLICSIIINELDEDRFSLLKFYERRARRILPALFVVMIACLPFAWLWLMPEDLKAFAQSMVAVVTFSSNILFWQESGYFATANDLKPLLHTWSLAVEEQYYIIFPLVLMFLWKKLSRAWIVTLLAAAFVGSLIVAEWGAYNKPQAAFYLLPTRAWELLIGVFAAFYLRYYTTPANRWVNETLSLLGMALILYAIHEFSYKTVWPGVNAAVPCVGTVLLILFAQPGTLVHKVLSLKPLVGIGLVSYSAYLWHQPLFAFAKYRYLELSTPVLLLICVLTFVFAFISWRWIEKPFRTKTFNRTQIFQFSGAFAAALLVVGVVGHVQNGFLDRYSEAEKQVLSGYIDANDYVDSRYMDLELVEFDTNATTRDVLIIGDSYAKDMVNAIHEAGTNENLSISTFYLPVACGNLFIDASILQRYQRQAKCVRYENEDLRARMAQADEIWLVSAWMLWTTQYMTESLQNIEAVTDADIVVFGGKYFGKRDAHRFLAERTMEPLLGPQMLPEHYSRTALWMARELPKITTYVDTAQVICGSYTSCGNSTPDGYLVSHDGDHLTQEGARWVGQLIDEHLKERELL